MKKTLLLAMLALAGSTYAVVDQVAVVPTRNQLRTLTNTLSFYPQVSLAVSGTGVSYVSSPVAGTVNGYRCVNNATLGGTSATISPSIAGVYMGAASATVVSGTAIGGSVSGVTTTSNTVAAGDALRMDISTGLTGAGTLNCQFLISPTLTY